MAAVDALLNMVKDMAPTIRQHREEAEEARRISRPSVQTRVAEAEAILSAARAYLVEAVGSAWQAICGGSTDPSREIARARLAITHAMHEAVRTALARSELGTSRCTMAMLSSSLPSQTGGDQCG